MIQRTPIRIRILRVAHRACSCALLVLALLLWVCTPASAASRYDPALRFRSITTEHFVIHYHQGEEALALRLASIAEQEHERRRLRHAPRGRTHVVLVDQDDEPNGWTTVVPYPLIEIRVSPPTGASAIGNTDDWLRMVFVHEYAHAQHLDEARGWATVAQRVFGRAWFAFPNAFLPEWQVEGLATWVESSGTHGRLSAGDFRVIPGEAARAGAFEPLDRVSGGLVGWPSGHGWYAYGALFHEYLAGRFGPETLSDLSARTAGRLPFVSAGAFKTVFGQSLGSLWNEFAAAERAKASARADVETPTAVTRRGYLTDGPRFDIDGSLLYARQDADGFPAIERVRGSGTPERVATRYGGGQIAPGRDAIYFDQLEVAASVALVSDLYRLDRATGRVRRLTRGARLAEPDVSPDGRRVAAIRISRGDRRLVILDRAALDAGAAAAANAIAAAQEFGRPGDIMAAPRWSPDSTRVAVELRRARAPGSRIVAFSADQPGTVARVLVESSSRLATPEWSPDGEALVYAEAPTGAPFNLKCARLEPPESARPLTSLAGGARSPAISADGRVIAFVGYTPAGHDVFTVPFACPGTPDNARGETGPGLASIREPFEAMRLDPSKVPSPALPYSPWPTLWPRAWYPVLDTSDDEVRVGASVSGMDALGYHGWVATATWSVARAGELEPVSPVARPDISVVYAYDRWRPTYYAQFTDETTPLLVRADDDVERPVALRERSGELVVALPFRRVRFSHSLLASYRVEHGTVRGPLDEATFDRAALRAEWSFQSAKRYGYSISREGGVSAGVGIERAAEALGGDGDATFVRADVRGYLAIGPPHAVLALRATGARSSGDRRVRRVLRLGGSDADGSVLSFDEDASSLLRGFASGRFAGTHLTLVNAEYRVPLARVERGWGTVPLFLRTVHAAGFFDAGDAWTSGGTRLSRWKRSWGGELSADVVVGYRLPLMLTAGAAWGRDGEGRVAPARTAYVRIGQGF